MLLVAECVVVIWFLNAFVFCCLENSDITDDGVLLPFILRSFVVSSNQLCKIPLVDLFL